MTRVNTQDPTQLKELSEDFLKSRAPHVHRGPVDGLWAELEEMGWAELPRELGLVETCLAMEALGYHLAHTPLLQQVLGGSLVEGGVAEVGARYIAAGCFVAEAHTQPVRRMDGRDCVRVDVVSLGPQVPDFKVKLDHARIALSAEMLGGMRRCFAITLDHLKTRHPSGKPIGANQALQHRAVDCFVKIELAHSTVMAAARQPTPTNASLAKATCSEAYVHIAKEAIQLHGGIGMTEACDVGLFLKRAGVCSHAMGTPSFHRRRWAEQFGY